ncbi:winged helix-turn-helix domain-containing protein [Dokdonella soli]|uniref:winged helix-turn-helix domain-containing protein n=1 Tax=Dokdonella soli TaxID=529810 RepID=UPI0031D54FBE
MAASIYRFRNFRLKSATREVREDERLVALPVSTVEYLVYLIEHRDRFVGRDELTAAVWGRTDVSEATLSHTIMRLRRMLGDSGSRGHSIRTVPRLGYRWVVETAIEQSPAQAPTLVSEEIAASPASPNVGLLNEVIAVSPRTEPIRSWALVSLLGALAVFAAVRYHHRGSAEVSLDRVTSACDGIAGRCSCIGRMGVAASRAHGSRLCCLQTSMRSFPNSETHVNTRLLHVDTRGLHLTRARRFRSLWTISAIGDTGSSDALSASHTQHWLPARWTRPLYNSPREK